ncbi:lipoprotein LpqH [Mycobacterium sp. AZCC_0083]|nr:lipoprotein LpqH [Mycobacterium sp. AZCC_0083]
MIKREFLVAAAGATVVATVLCGCSADKSNTSSSSSSSTTAASTSGSSTTAASASGSQSASPDAGASTWTVTVNGEEKSVQGTVNCRQRGNGAVEIITSGSAPGSGIDTDVTDGDPLFVGGISLGDSFNGGLTYREGSDVGEVTGSKDGNTYTISGTGVGSGHKTFQVEVTCP